ncbi:MAG: hypothetical protein CL565_04470 [Alphaproteobacteria bacterium]|nr:hypothetical protein [Alphaproteobacteria bacterium]|tara:strand:- start:1179 stop:1556 length:378 start_codon:yes stop_codon:yes gene_type:complete
MKMHKNNLFYKAIELQDEAARQNFEWKSLNDILKKCREELEELEESIALGDLESIEEELGDLLFVLANIGRNTKIDPNMALENSINKFINRYKGMIESSNVQNKVFSKLSSEEMLTLWKAQKNKS